MITVNVMSYSTHCKRNQTAIDVTVAGRVYKYVTEKKPMLMVLPLTILSAIMRPFQPVERKVIL